MGVLKGGADDGSQADDRAGSVGRSPLVGRTEELAVVEGLAGEVAVGVGGVLLVAGEQGIGKSALLRAGLSRAEGMGCRVVWGAADELDQMFPLRFIGRCLAEAEAGLPGAGGSALVPEAGGGQLGGVSSGDMVRAGVEQVLALVDRLCAVSPVVLVAEDLQWADEASLEVWERLSEAAVQLPLLLAGSFRPAPSGGELEGLRREVAAAGGTAIELGPLSAGEVAELAARVLGARPGQRLAELAGRAGGNPLYVRELVDALVRDGRVAVEMGVAELAAEPGEVPQTLAAAIADRLGVLPAEVTRVLRYAAVLGLEFSVADLGLLVGGTGGTPGSVAAASAGEVARLMAQAAAAGVVNASGEGTAEFRHGLIRQAVYEQIPVPVRGALHSQVARALAGAGAPPERVAAHLAAGPAAGSEWEYEWLAGVAPVLSYLAPQVAAGLLRRALAALPSTDPRREDLELGLLMTAALTWDFDEITRVARPLLARTANPDVYGEVGWLLVSGLAGSGRLAEAVEAGDQALAWPGLSTEWAARILARKALSQVIQGQLDTGESAARQAIADGERVGDGHAVASALHALAFAAQARHDPAAEIACLERGTALLGDEPRDIVLKLLMVVSKQEALAQTDRLDEAGAVIREALALAERTGAQPGIFCTYAAGYYLEVGAWDDALAVLGGVRETTGDSFHIAVHGLAALIAAHRDDWAAASGPLAAIQDVDPADPFLQGLSYALVQARALAAERAGDLAGAVAALAFCLNPVTVMGERYRLLPLLTRLAVAVGEAGTARAAADAAVADAAAGLPVVKAAAEVCRGMVDSDPEPLLAAAAYYQSPGRPLRRAEALEEAAVLLARRGEESAARRTFAGAVTGYQELGAVFDLRRADARLRALGIRRARPGRRQAPAHGWEALTGTERVIAGLVAQGRSNPDIAAELMLSRSTVQTHVSHILAKLGARSRADIIRHALHV